MEFSNNAYLWLYLCMCSASSKQRSNLRRAIAADKAKIQAAIKKCLLVQQLLPSHDHLQLAEEAIMNGAFPWSALAGALQRVIYM